MINREKVYKKCNGHCAYCGVEITLKQMQVDHIHPQYLDGQDDENNLFPACRSCNSTKATYTIEKFRTRLIADVNRLRRDSSKFRILERFGIVSRTKTELKFYFEEM